MCAVLSILASIALASAPPPRSLGAAPRAVIEAAVASPGTRAELLGLEGTLPPRCALIHAEAPRPAAASGRVAVHLFGKAEVDGAPCDAWAWARVRVSAPTLITTRPLSAGTPLEGAVATAEREMLPGRPPLDRLPEGATAERALPAGMPLDLSMVRTGPRPGNPVLVVARVGSLLVERQATALACGHGRACALLPSGRRVEGNWHDGRILLEVP